MYANIDILLCGRPNGPHYGYLSVRLHVCPITTPNRSQKSVRLYLAPLLRYNDWWLKWQIFPTPLSFSAFFLGDPLQIYQKSLRFLKLESSRLPMVKI